MIQPAVSYPPFQERKNAFDLINRSFCHVKIARLFIS